MNKEKIKPGDLVKLRCSDKLSADFYGWDGEHAYVTMHDTENGTWTHYHDYDAPLLYLGMRYHHRYYHHFDTFTHHKFLWENRVYYTTVVSTDENADVLERTFQKVS